jgi:hypothetical protein
MVLANVAGAGSAMIASTSSRWSAMPRSNAGSKCSFRISANGGSWKGRELGEKNGFSVTIRA